MVRRLMRLGPVLALAAGLFLVPSPASAAEVSPAAEEGFQEISQCLQSRNDLAVLLVVDESASLQATDPNDKRARLLANLVRALGRQAGKETATGQRRIDLAVSTFSMDYRPLVPWTEITPASSEGIAAGLETQIPSLDQGGGTNHLAALRGVRNQVAEIASTKTDGLPPCTLTVLFTDGVLDVSDNDAEDAAAAREMCRPRGVVDGVRRDGINLVTVMLFDRRVAEDAPDAYQNGRDLLQAAAEGEAGSDPCGTVPIPPRSARGAYLEGEVDRLATLFATAFALSNGATQLQKDGSPVEFTIDPGIASFSIIGAAPQGIQLKGPAGQAIDIEAGTGGKGEVRSYWDFDTVTVEKAVAPEDQGEWTVIRPGRSDAVSLFLNSGLGIKLDEAQIIAGEPAQISGQIVRVGGDDPVDLAVYRNPQLTVAPVGGSPMPLTLGNDGTFSGTLELDTAASVAQVDVSLALQTQSGQALVPVAGRFTLDVTLPKEFPQVTPALLTLSPLVGKDGEAQGILTATGSTEGPTKVCVEGSAWEADDPAIYATELATGCFDLAAGEKRDIALAVTTSAATDERVTGTIPLQLTSSTGAEQGVDIAAAFTATRPLNQAVRAGVVAALALLGLLLPAAILYGFNRHLAKFRPKDGIRSLVEPAVVSKAGVRSRQPAAPSDGSATTTLFELPAERLRVMALPDRAPRVLPGPDGSELRTHVPKSVFGNPSAEVLAGEGMRVVSSRPPFIHGHGRSAPVSFGLGDIWYATISDADLIGKTYEDGIPVLISAYVPSKGHGDSIHDISGKIRNFDHWETVISQLRSSAVADAGQHATASGAAPAKPATPGSSAPRPSGPGASGTRPTEPSTRPTGPGGSGGRPTGPGGRPTGPGGSTARPSGPTTPTSSPSGPTTPTSRPSGPTATPPADPPRPPGPSDGPKRRPGGPS